MSFPFALLVLAVTTGVSLIGLAGGFFLVWKSHAIERWSLLLMSFSAGSILGATFFELFPEALANGDSSIQSVLNGALIGILFFFMLEKLLVWHHHSHQHVDEEHAEPMHHRPSASVRPLIIIGDAVHNFLDGSIIAVAFLTNPALGIITSLAVIAHEIPQEIGDFTVLLNSGMAKRRVILWNILGALVSPLGSVLVLLNTSLVERIEGPLLAFVVGNFIYIALADLIPTIQHERRLRQSLAQFALILVGVGIVWQLALWLPGA
jgi:zinc and cadmium transporter